MALAYWLYLDSICDDTRGSAMEVLSGKRQQEPEQTVPVESFAVCNSCNRLSKNLKICENCSSKLSEDNSASISDPKRQRIESTSPPVTTTAQNGSTKTSMPVVNGTTESVAMDIASNAVRPEALFVNVNHQAFPVAQRPGGLAGQANAQQPVNGTSVTAVRPRPIAPTPVVSSTTSNLSTANSDSVTNNVVRPSPLVNSQHTTLVNAPTNAPRLMNTSSLQAARPTTTPMALPTYNLQPPPPPFSSNVARLPSSASQIPNVVPGGGTTQTISIPSLQIRIGTKKFKPISPVTFKEDGILFTLKDYTYAPVLLNARAIVKCKANLNTFSYPVLFLFLENSCMRQIRNIFGLTSSEFAAASPVELKRCITIFPIFGTEGKSQVQQMMYSIRRSFEAMVRRYPRSSSILEDITNDQVIDILLDVTSEGSGASDQPTEPHDKDVNTNTQAAPALSAAVTAPTETTAAASTVVTLNSGQQSNISSRAYQTRPTLQSTGSETTLTNSHAVASNNLSTQSGALQAPAVRSQSQSSAPVLVIPNDSTRWQMIQKSLVVGGVYHVMMPTGQRKYCLWNGTQLVPCLVQNTEVQLACARVRFGSALSQCAGQVRIRADSQCGIYFTVKNELGTKEINITPGDIVNSQLCFHNKMTLLIVSTTWHACDKMNKILGLPTSGNDKKFDVSCSDMSKRYVVLFLTDVNKDQEEALTQMKVSNQSSVAMPMFKIIDFTKAISVMAEIMCKSEAITSVSHYLESQRLYGSSGFEKLAHALCDFETPTLATDDDDDDVIMTQEEVGVKCPYTQQVMKDPVRNTICGHNYEKSAIHEFIVRKKGTAKCPYAGCGNTNPLRPEDLIENRQLREYIKSNNGTTS